MSPHEPFLRSIADQPGEEGPKLVYADWLEERGDPRAELIRLAVELNRIRHRLLTLPDRIAELSRNVDGEWLMMIFGRFRVVLMDFPPEKKIQAILLIRQVTGHGLAEAKSVAENRPSVIIDGVPWDAAQRVGALFQEHARVNIEPSSRLEAFPAGAPLVVPSYRIILRSYLNGAKLQTIKALRSLTSLGSTAARELIESLPRVLRERATYHDVERFRAALRPFAEIEAVPMDIPYS